MINASTAIAAARALLGTPYGSGAGELDCINLIKTLCRDCPGGEKHYTTAGTNTLWRSYAASGKYRDLTWRQVGLSRAKAGMLALMERGTDVYHVGLVTGEGTVIHASQSRGKVVETPLALGNGWNLLAKHRLIAVAGEEAEEEAEEAEDEAMGEQAAALYKAHVFTQGGALNVRDAPSTKGRVLGKLAYGASMDVMRDVGNGWLRVRAGDMLGYVSAQYVERDAVEVAAQETTQETERGAEKRNPLDCEDWGVEGKTTFICEETGTCITLAGRWRVMED